jgi:hypothetical protein
MFMDTLLLSAQDAATPAVATKIIKSDGLVAIPTETVYGLGANGLSPTAVAKMSPSSALMALAELASSKLLLKPS